MLTALSVLLATKVSCALTLCFAQEFLLANGLSCSILTFVSLALTAIILVPYTHSTRFLSGPSSITKWSPVISYSITYAFSTFLLLKGLTFLSPLRISMLTEYGELWQLGFLTILKLSSKKTGLLDQSHLLGLGLGTFSLFMALVMDFTQHTGYTISERVLGYVCVLSSVWVSAVQKSVLGPKISREMQGAPLLGIASAIGALGISPVAGFVYLTSSNTGATQLWSRLGVYTMLGVIFVIAFILASQYSNSVGGISTQTDTRIILGWGLMVATTLIYTSLSFTTFARLILEVALIAIYGTGLYYLLQADPSLPFKMGVTSKASSGVLLPTHDGVFAISTSGAIHEIGTYIQIILGSQDSRQIFYFLLLNLSYMFVQMIYGVWTNSLGLISDAIHMFFDCLALGIGLFASVMSKWPANKTFSFGYTRIETLSGFSNGIFLILISIFIVIEAVERLIHPPEMNTHRLLLVSFVGFVVNLIGIFAFNHGHGHGHGHAHGHGHGQGQCHGHNANMQGVFLHIMADTLGSVGVIISTLLIEQFGWTGFDPIASIFIASLIFLSVIPLIKNSMSILMLQSSHEVAHSLERLLPQITNIPGVQSYSNVRFWADDSETSIGTLHLTIADDVDESRIRHEVSSLVKSNVHGLKELCIQIEKPCGFNSCLCKTESNPHSHSHSHSHSNPSTHPYSHSSAYLNTQY